MGLAPFAIHQADIARGEITCLLEDPKHDLLGPQLTPGGDLYYIRRPYQSQGGSWSPGRALLDLVLFPFRLLHALFQYLNFFTAAYTGKPLTTAGGERQRAADVRQMMIWGNLISADKSVRGGGEDASGLVPDSWQLVRQARSGSTTILAKGVLSFDLCEDQSLIYTNGSAIFHLDHSGAGKRLHEDKLIEHVVACD
jgi:hypothetical protein